MCVACRYLSLPSSDFSPANFNLAHHVTFSCSREGVHAKVELPSLFWHDFRKI